MQEGDGAGDIRRVADAPERDGLPAAALTFFTVRFIFLVWIAPGPTTLTRMPNGARSMAIVRVMASMPPLVASYAAILRCARAAANELMLTIAPRVPWSTMMLAARWQCRYTLVRFVCSTVVQCCRSISRMCACGEAQAALLTTMSTLPNESSTCWNMASTSLSRPASPGIARTDPPAASILRAASRNGPRAAGRHDHLCAFAGQSLGDTPAMPRLAPVTIATLLSSLIRRQAYASTPGA